MSEVPADVWDALSSDDPESRLRAARRLVQYAGPEDAVRVRGLRVAEKDAITHRLLKQAEERISRATTSSIVEPESIAAIERRATRAVAGMFLHELGPLVGRLEYQLVSEIPDFTGLKASDVLEEMRAFLDAARRLQAVSRTPVSIDLDLTELIREVATDVIDEFRQRAGEAPLTDVLLARDDPTLVNADPTFLRLALANGLRNAMEACEACDGVSPAGIVVNWGRTDRDVWVSILDEGIGLPAGVGNLFAPSQTTKRGGPNMGMGLSIAKAAMEGLGGAVILLPREPRGTRFEIRWPGSTR